MWVIDVQIYHPNELNLSFCVYMCMCASVYIYMYIPNILKAIKYQGLGQPLS